MGANDSYGMASYKSMETLDPRGRANLDPSSLIGRIYVGDH